MRILTGCLIAFGLLTMTTLAVAEEKPQSPPEESPPRIQMAILLDTSGSMSGLINQARTQLW
ncbi:MAG: vWA domain-containing protein, partial [Planctomycetaceae bacterium]